MTRFTLSFAALFAALALSSVLAAAAQQDSHQEGGWKRTADFGDGKEIQWRASAAPGCDGSNVELRFLNNSNQSGSSRLTSIALTCKRGKPFAAPDMPVGVVSPGGAGATDVIPCACANQGGVLQVATVMLDFRLEGKGEEVSADGCSYAGSFSNAQRQGQGKYSCPNGYVYEGMFRAGQPNGRGAEKMANGQSYTGEFVNAAREGRGQMKYADGSSYDGVFIAGQRDGIGMMTYPDGGQYTGDWKQDTRTGQGAYTGPRMAWTYDGEWLNDQQHGQGRLKYADGSYAFEGAFANGKPSGVGATTFGDGRVFRGDYREGEQVGPGTMLYPDGRKIVGDFRNHVPNGKASDISATATFEGNWVDGRLDGQAVVTTPGTRFEGEFRNGKRNGLGVEVRADGARMECAYVDDVPQKGCKTVRGKNPKIEYRK